MLIHYSKEPLGKLQLTTQSAVPAYKPTGLWVSEETTGWGWSDWCFTESFAIDRFKFATEVKLRKGHRVKHLSRADQLLALSRRFGSSYGLSDHIWTGAGHTPPVARIDWRALARDWQGLLIFPYIDELRLDDRAHWYYPWDCASGCIWDPEAIQELIPRPDLAWQFNERVEHGKKHRAEDGADGAGEADGGACPPDRGSEPARPVGDVRGQPGAGG